MKNTKCCEDMNGYLISPEEETKCKCKEQGFQWHRCDVILTGDKPLIVKKENYYKCPKCGSGSFRGVCPRDCEKSKEEKELIVEEYETWVGRGLKIVAKPPEEKKCEMCETVNELIPSLSYCAKDNYPQKTQNTLPPEEKECNCEKWLVHEKMFIEGLCGCPCHHKSYEKKNWEEKLADLVEEHCNHEKRDCLYHIFNPFISQLLEKQKSDLCENFEAIKSMDRKMLSIDEVTKIIKDNG